MPHCETMKFAYADPPYIGQSKKHYKDHPDYAGEVDHNELIKRLMSDYPDGWALSASSPSLHQIVPMLPKEARFGAWVKPFCSFKPNVNPAYAWEPVVFYGGRKRGRDIPTLRDYESCNITLKKGLCGVKPDKVCFWIFEFLGMKPGDRLDDLFPGSGAVTRAWEQYQSVAGAGEKPEGEN